MKVSKQRIKILSFFDIIVGLIYVLFTLIGMMDFNTVYEFSQGMQPSDMYFGLALSIIFGAVLAYSGYIIVESKMQRNDNIIGWLGMIFGGIFVITSIFPIFTQVINYSYTSLMISYILSLIGFSVMTLNGITLRKLL